MEAPLTLCDLTQSYSSKGGGIGTYLRRKRRFIAETTPHRHVLIIPGPEDRITVDGALVTAEIKSPQVPNSPNYRLLLRNKAVKAILKDYAPASIECLDAYNLPWAAIGYRKEVPETKLIAGYRTDFPTVYVEKILQNYIGGWAARKLKNRAYKYAGRLYSHFDAMYALNRTMGDKLEDLGAGQVDVLPLGTNIDIFSPDARDMSWRQSIGANIDDLVLIYAGRIDKEKQPDVVIDAFMQLPKEMNAHLCLLGEGNLMGPLKEKTSGLNVHFLGYVSDRAELAKMLASSDLYVSAMAYETFGISIIEAQACGLPVIGVAEGAMPDRVSPELGRLGAFSDADEMAHHIQDVWNNDLHKAMSLSARQHVVDNFSWEKTFSHLFEQIYTHAGLNIYPTKL